MNHLQSFCCLALGLLWSANFAHAQHSASVSTSVERIENPALSAISPGGVTVLRVVPSYALETRADRSQSRVSLSAVIERSSNTDLLASRNYPSLGYVWVHDWSTSSLELRGNLAESATRNTEFAELGRVTVDSRERTLAVGARWSQELTARTEWSLNLENSKVSYDSASLAGYRELEFSSRVTWEARESLFYYIEPAYARLTSVGITPASARERWSAGLRGDLAPGLSVASFAGLARTSGTLSSTSAVAGLQLAFSGSRWSAGVDLARDVTPSAADAAYVRIDNLALRLGYQLAEGANLSAVLTQSRSSGTGGASGQVASLTLDNELDANWSSTLGFENRRSHPIGGSTGRAWSIRTGLVYAFPGR